MKRVLALRPTPATVISAIALFVALGGVSYGFATGSIDSREIANNTVRSKDVRNNNLTTRDLRNNEIRSLDVRNRNLRGRDIALNTLTDDEIAESKLTRVPSAANADRLGGRAADQFAAARSEPVRAIGAPGQPGFQSGYAAAGGGALPPGFWKDPFGVVHLEGAVSGPGGTAFTLPDGYRPGGTASYSVFGDVAPVAPNVLEIGTDGRVAPTNGGVAGLDGVTFRASS